MYSDLIQNTALLVALSALYGLISRLRSRYAGWLKFCMGLLFGVVAVAGMMIPFRYAPGIIYDGRSIVLSMAGLFGGLTVASIAAVIGGAYRVILGGAGVWAGLATIVFCSLVGLIFRRAYGNRPERLGVPALYTLGVTAHIVMLGCQLVFLPWPTGIDTIKSIWLPVMLIYPVATVLVGLLLGSEDKRWHLERELSNSLDLLLKSQSIGMVGSWEFDIVNNRLQWSKEAYCILGIDPEKFDGTYEAFLECVHPDDRQAVDSAHRDSIHEGLNGYEIEYRIIRCDSGEMRIVYEKCEHHKDTSGTVIRSVGFVQDITKRKKVEEELNQLKDQLQLQIDRMPIGLIVWDTKFRVQSWNPSAKRIFGYTSDEALGRSPHDFIVPKKVRPHIDTVWQQLLEGDKTAHSVNENIRKDGSIIICEWTNIPLKKEDGKIVGILSMIQDITERKKAEEKERQLEEQLVQAQKLESIGRLAGGVAHDFNNMLNVILGHADIVLQQLRPDDPLRKSMKEIVKAGRRSAALTRQLLAFSRKQTLQPQVLDINDIVRNFEKMLRRLISEGISLELSLASALPRVNVDPGQIEQVIMNLAVNAHDAMPMGGKLLIETSAVELDDAYAKTHTGVIPGNYVMLAITDTGCGMDAETRERVFEPFFTTKDKHRGTGLGLSTAYGIVKQHGGNIWVYSEPGKGTTFKIYLPVTREQPVKSAEQAVQMEPSGDGEQILLVEDEESLRELLKAVLSRLNYRVTVAANGDEALLLVEKKGLKPDLLITDVVMPNMGGRELADRLQRNRPGLRVLFMSGYTDNAIVHHGVLDQGTHFIQKPFTNIDLAEKVQDLLRDKKP